MIVINIVIIRSNPVRPDSRVEKEAWTLTKAGHHVHILAWDRDNNHPSLDETIDFIGHKIPITRIGFKAGYSQGFKSLKPFLQFQFAMRKWIRQNKKKIDVIHACDFDTAFFSFSVARHNHIKFIFDIFDFLYSEPKSLLQKTVKKAQLRLVTHSDATIICTEERKSQIAGAIPKRLVVIHNTPSEEMLDSQKERIINISSNKPKVAYVGILQNERMLEKIGHYFSLHPEVEFHIGGFGTLDKYFEELSEKCGNIFFYGRIPYNETLNLERQCDIMTAIYDPSDENCRNAAPNKFYEGLMLGKPLIMTVGTGMTHVITENDIGVLIEFSENGFEKGLNQLIERKKDWKRMSETMQGLYWKSYSWGEMEKRLTKLYQSIQ